MKMDYKNTEQLAGLEEQKKLALQTRARETARAKRKIRTEITPFTEFTLAEAYHQKYQLRQDRVLMREYSSIYPDTKDFVDSTAVARANGYLGGYGTIANLEAELDSLGLSPGGAQRPQDIVPMRSR